MDDASLASDLSAHVAWTQALARQLVRDGAEAEDVAQEALVRVLEHPPREAGALRGYLVRVLGNVRSQRARGAGRRAARERLVARAEAEPATDELVERLAWQRRLSEAVERLEEPFRGAILLRFFEGLPPRAIAARLGVPVKTVDSRLQRALERLRLELDRSQGGRRAWALALCAWLRSAPAHPPVGAPAARWALAAGLLAALVWSGARLWPRSTAAGEPELLARAQRGESASPASSAPSSGERREPGASSAPAPALVTGRVLGADGAALAGARVELFQPPFAGFEVLVDEFRLLEPRLGETRTAADGSFALEAPSGVPLRVRAAAGGLGAEQREDVHAGDALELVLAPAGRIVVQANRQGMPCVGAVVELGRQGVAWPAWRGATDARGRLEAGGLAHGIYTVECSPLDGTRAFVLDVALAPGGEAATAFEIEPGRELAGVVREARSGRPLSSASAAVSVKGSRSGPVACDANGAFRLRGLPADFPEWTVEVSAEGYAPARRSVRADEAPAELSLELEPELRLAGTVVDASGRALGGAWIACGTRGARTDEQGRFELGGLAPGSSVVVLVRAPGLASWVGTSLGREGERRRDLGRLALAPGACLAGRVRTSLGQAVANAVVELQRLAPPEGSVEAPVESSGAVTSSITSVSRAEAPARGAAPAEPVPAAEVERAGARAARSNSLGLFRLDDLAPGRYRLRARANGFEATDALQVELPAGGLADLELVFDEGLSLSGSVRGSDGLPLANAWLVLRGAGSGGGGPAQLSGLDGRFVLRGVPAGPVQLEVSHHQMDAGGEYLYLREVAALEAPRADLELVLPRNRPIEGRVLDEAGRPLAGYRVSATDGDGRRTTAESDAEGRFRVGAAEGRSVVLELEGPSARESEEARRAAVLERYEARLASVPAGSAGIELRARPRR